MSSGLMSPAHAAGWLAAGSSGSSSDVTPGLLGFLVIAGIGVVLFFLLRSMNKHLRRVRAVRDAGLQPGSKIEAAAGPAAEGGARPGGGHGGAAAVDTRNPPADTQTGQAGIRQAETGHAAAAGDEPAGGRAPAGGRRARDEPAG